MILTGCCVPMPTTWPRPGHWHRRGWKAVPCFGLNGAGLGPGAQVPDPYYGSDADFEQVWELVSRAARATCQAVAR